MALLTEGWHPSLVLFTFRSVSTGVCVNAGMKGVCALTQRDREGVVGTNCE